MGQILNAGSVLAPFLDRAGSVVLDGGLATELQQRGHDLSDTLWSARLLLDDPRAILDVHRSYLDAGADCLTTASYQASFPGLAARGLSSRRAGELLELSVSLAAEARDRFVAEEPDTGRPRPLVAASVGPYGAYLADGSEYRGRYGVSRERLLAFHAPRLERLLRSGPDLVACETIPDAVEASVLAELLSLSDHAAWVSFSCRDGHRLHDGSEIREVAAMVAKCRSVLAIGVNCTAPAHLPALIEQVRLGAPGKSVVVYPNSGEHYDGDRRSWVGESDPADFGRMARTWRRSGATLIGGCCRTGPGHIAAIRESLDL